MAEDLYGFLEYNDNGICHIEKISISHNHTLCGKNEHLHKFKCHLSVKVSKDEQGNTIYKPVPVGQTSYSQNDIRLIIALMQDNANLIKSYLKEDEIDTAINKVVKFQDDAIHYFCKDCLAKLYAAG